jgi:polysaccharide biosynthesis protein VpsQ
MFRDSSMKWIAGLFTIFIIMVVVAADRGQLPTALRWLTHYGGDKTGHFILFGLLNLFICLALLARQRTNVKRIIIITSLVLTVLTGIEEASQSLFATRTADTFDLLASWLGIVVFGFIAYQIKKQP